jgi:hypothetical protein
MVNLRLHNTAYLHREYPGLHFERDVTAGLARYSLAVDFDFYWLNSDRRERTEASQTVSFPTDFSRGKLPGSG